VMLAELGMANGVDLYAENNGALKRLVQVGTQGLLDPSFFEKRTGVKQERSATPPGDAMGWAEPYNQRFPDATITKMLEEQPNHSEMYLGGLPPA
jgi:poly(beta-D-mannuronate) lyase